MYSRYFSWSKCIASIIDSLYTMWSLLAETYSTGCLCLISRGKSKNDRNMTFLGRNFWFILTFHFSECINNTHRTMRTCPYIMYFLLVERYSTRCIPKGKNKRGISAIFLGSNFLFILPFYLSECIIGIHSNVYISCNPCWQKDTVLCAYAIYQ